MYEPREGRYLVESDPLSALSAVYDYEALAETLDLTDFLSDHDNMSRFLPLLPLDEGINLQGGNLPATPVDQIKLRTNNAKNQSVVVKVDSRQPFGSIWDRGSVVALSRANEWGMSDILLGTVGPSARSVSKYAGRENFRTIVMLRKENEEVPSDISARLGLFWDRPDANFPSLLEITRRYDFYLGTPGWNPYFVEGIKTVAYEMTEQLNFIPDTVYVGTRFGLLVQSLEKGYRELETLGWIPSRPEIVQVTVEDLPPECEPEESGRWYGSLSEEHQAEIERIISPEVGQPRRMKVDVSTIEALGDDCRRTVEGNNGSLEVGLAGLKEDEWRDPEDQVCVLVTGDRKDPAVRTSVDTVELHGGLQSLPETFPEPGYREETTSDT